MTTPSWPRKDTPLPLVELEWYYTMPEHVPGNRCRRTDEVKRAKVWVTYPPKRYARCEFHRYDEEMEFPTFDPAAGPDDMALWQPNEQFCLAAMALLRRESERVAGEFDGVYEAVAEVSQGG